MREYLLKRFEYYKLHEGGFQKSNPKWRNVFILNNGEEMHISKVKTNEMTDHQLVRMFEKVVSIAVQRTDDAAADFDPLDF